MLDNKTFEAYQGYDWGKDPAILKPVDDAIVASHGDPATRKDLETKIAAVIGSKAPRAAKDYACRQLRTIGTAASVPALAALLAEEELSHMARYALERIPAPEAAKALRDALATTTAKLKVGVISSLGVRAEAESVAPLKALLNDADGSVATAATLALGVIGSADAGKALASVEPTAATKAVLADSSLCCAEKLLASGNKAGAKAVYQRLLGSNPSAAVKTAAGLGVKACGG